MDKGIFLFLERALDSVWGGKGLGCGVLQPFPASLEVAGLAWAPDQI